MDPNQTPPAAPTSNPTPAPTAPAAAPIAPTPSAGTQNTKLIVAIVVAALVIVGAICAAVLLNNKKSDQGTSEEQTTSESLTELALDDALVEKTYGWFAGKADSNGEVFFRVDPDATSGNPSRLLMLGFSWPEDAMPEQCDFYAEAINASPNEPTSDCIRGEAVRAQAKKLFGKDVVLEEGDRLGACNQPTYVSAKDAFYFVWYDSCESAYASDYNLQHEAYKAERDDQRIYVYEKVLAYNNSSDANDFYHVGDRSNLLGEHVGKPYIEDDASCKTAEVWIDCYNETVERNRNHEREFILENGDAFKWTFVKNNDGNYIFEKVERL